MNKMLFEVQLPLVIAKAKEDLGVNNIWKYLRYIRMFTERSKLKIICYGKHTIFRSHKSKCYC